MLWFVFFLNFKILGVVSIIPKFHNGINSIVYGLSNGDIYITDIKEEVKFKFSKAVNSNVKLFKLNSYKEYVTAVYVNIQTNIFNVMHFKLNYPYNSIELEFEQETSILTQDVKYFNFYKNNTSGSIMLSKTLNAQLFYLSFRDKNNIHNFRYRIRSRSPVKFSTFNQFINLNNETLRIESNPKERNLVIIYNTFQVRILEPFEKDFSGFDFQANSIGDMQSVFYEINQERDYIISNAIIKGDIIKKFNVNSTSDQYNFNPSQNLNLIVTLQHKINDKSKIIIHSLKEFKDYREPTLDVYNPTNRVKDFEDSNFDINSNLIDGVVSDIKEGFFDLPSDHYMNNTLVSMYVCNKLTSNDREHCFKQLENVTNEFEIFSKINDEYLSNYLYSNWQNLVFASVNNKILIYSYPVTLLNDTNVEFKLINSIQLTGENFNFEISDNSMFMYHSVTRRKLELDSLIQIKKLCTIHKLNPEVLLLQKFDQLCGSFSTYEIPLNYHQFGLISSAVEYNHYCSSFKLNMKQSDNVKGTYIKDSLTIKNCEKGNYCQNGIKFKCPIGYICPNDTLSNPIPCNFNNQKKTCFKKGLISPINCPIGSFCENPYDFPIATPPGYYSKNNSKVEEISKCDHGEWCSIQTNYNPNQNRLCPKGAYCNTTSIVPSRCTFNINETDYW